MVPRLSQGKGSDRRGNLRADFNDGTVGDETPDLLDRLVADGDAAGGPVFPKDRWIGQLEAARKSMDEDRTAGIAAPRACERDILRARIGDVQRKVILGDLATVDRVCPFGGSIVPLAPLGTNGIAPEI